jgi:hypothetical protein
MRCQAAKPSHGETWQPIAKDDKNGEKLAKEILTINRSLQCRSVPTQCASGKRRVASER